MRTHNAVFKPTIPTDYSRRLFKPTFSISDAVCTMMQCLLQLNNSLQESMTQSHSHKELNAFCFQIKLDRFRPVP